MTSSEILDIILTNPYDGVTAERLYEDSLLLVDTTNDSEIDYETSTLSINQQDDDSLNNWWAMLALILVVGTAAGNILVCLAITWEKRLQNVTNYFLMSLAITDLMVAVLVMPLGILTLVRGK